MIDLKTSKDHYASQFEELEKRSAGREDVWLLPLRKAAFARFSELGFPSTKHEEWRYTNVAPIARSEFGPASADVKSVTREQLSPFLFGDPDPTLLVFVNGFFNERRLVEVDDLYLPRPEVPIHQRDPVALVVLLGCLDEDIAPELKFHHQLLLRRVADPCDARVLALELLHQLHDPV